MTAFPRRGQYDGTLLGRHYAEFLVGLGFAAFTFDFAGGCVLGGKSDGRTDEMSVLTEADDLCAVLDHVRRLPYVDRSKVFLMGCSQGDLVSALVAVKRPSEAAPSCVICCVSSVILRSAPIHGACSRYPHRSGWSAPESLQERMSHLGC